MSFLHEGRPGRSMEALWTRNVIITETGRRQASPLHINAPCASENVGATLAVARPFADNLLALLRHPTIASKESIVRRYDHDVQGATVIKPLVGRSGNGPGDAAVLQPILDVGAQFIEPVHRAGIILPNGINPLYVQIDPYPMAINT